LSKNVALFIDVANIYYAARGQDVDVDYIALLKHVTKGRDLIRAYAYSGLDPENENQRKFLDFLSKNGYKVVHKDIRKFGDGRVKANLDIELVVDLFRLADRMDIAVIVSGDGDFASAIRALQDVGVRCEVISFRPNTSSDLIAVADEFTDIMKIIGIGRAKESKVLPMPEMPAKEVNPEFGFREASRGVAAAALAALREGGEQPSRSRRGRGTRSTSAQPPSEPVSAVAAADDGEPSEPVAAVDIHVEGAETIDGARRRRRRRGGRGRGRSRRPDEPLETGAVAGPSDEIGWQEFDDISQLGDLTDLGAPGEEREFGFAEADAATLAELGLTPGASEDRAPAATATDAPAQPAAEPRRRAPRGGRTRPARTETPAASPADEEPAAAAEAVASTPRPRRRRAASSAGDTGTTAVTGELAEPADADQAAPPPRRTRSRRPTGGTSGRTRSASSRAPSEPAVGEAGAESSSAPSRARRPRRSSSAAAAADGEPTAESASGEGTDEGIWQRFRSGRRPTRRTTS
jgi:uncharacterized LabA/DUF88 family protein